MMRRVLQSAAPLTPPLSPYRTQVHKMLNRGFRVLIATCDNAGSGVPVTHVSLTGPNPAALLAVSNSAIFFLVQELLSVSGVFSSGVGCPVTFVFRARILPGTTQ